MKNRTILSMLIAVFFVQVTFAQKSLPKFEVSAGIGLLPTFLKDKKQVNVLPASLTIDYRVNKKFSVGLLVGYSKATTNVYDKIMENPAMVTNDFSVATARVAIHNMTYKKWDVYGGIALGVAHSKFTVKDGDVSKLIKHKKFTPTKTSFLPGAFVGARYDIASNLAIYGEVGTGLSILSIGMTKKF